MTCDICTSWCDATGQLELGLYWWLMYKTAVYTLVNGIITHQKQQISRKWYMPLGGYSIRRSANGRSEANDVSLLWRHLSWSRSWRLERAYRRPFLRFWWNLNPKMLSAILWTPKRHFLTSKRVFGAIVREIPCTGCFSRRVRGKIKRKKKGLIFHIFRQALPYGRLAKILGYLFASWT